MDQPNSETSTTETTATAPVASKPKAKRKPAAKKAAAKKPAKKAVKKPAKKVAKKPAKKAGKKKAAAKKAKASVKAIRHPRANSKMAKARSLIDSEIKRVGGLKKVSPKAVQGKMVAKGICGNSNMAQRYYYMVVNAR